MWFSYQSSNFFLYFSNVVDFSIYIYIYIYIFVCMYVDP